VVPVTLEGIVLEHVVAGLAHERSGVEHFACVGSPQLGRGVLAVHVHVALFYDAFQVECGVHQGVCHVCVHLQVHLGPSRHLGPAEQVLRDPHIPRFFFHSKSIVLLLIKQNIWRFVI